MASLTEPSLDEDIPDNVSITLVLHADSAGLDSPTKESMKMQLHSKMDPEQPQQEVGSFSFRTSPEGFETLPIISTQETPTKRAAALPADTMDTFPAIEHIHQALSTKVMSSQQKEEPKHRSRSMIVSGTSADSSGAPPPNSSLDRKKSPSEKFRSFMKSFAPVRNESMESFGENDEDLTLGGGELSIKVGTPFKSSGSSKKFFSPEEETAQKSALKARIARVQEEQAKFRLSQKVRMHHGSPHSASNSFKEQAKEKEKARKAKAPKSGLAPCFSNALLGGLRRSEFRETRELGAAMLKHTHRHRLGDDLFNADSLPMSHLGLDLGLGVGLDLQADSDSAAAEATAAEATSSSDRRTRTYTPDPMPPPLILPRMYRVPSEHSVTLTGDEYMSEEDWRITNREQQQKRKAALLGKTASLPPGASSESAASSQQNLEQFVEAALREQATLRAPTADCQDAPDVPLSYLQSSNLIEKRFGWDTRDYSVTQPVLVKHKSWVALRNAVAGAGAFNLIAAAAAAPPMDESATASGKMAAMLSDARARLEPGPSAPVIVIEATSVTELVAKLVKEHRTAALGEGTDHSEGGGGGGGGASIASASEDDGSISSPTRSKLPAFTISKEIPQRMSADRHASPPRAHSPPGPALAAFAKPAQLVVAKEDANNAKIKANTKEFHDRYHGLIFKDSSRNLIWQDTEDLILGAHLNQKNKVLNARSDMRWAGKTLNMFRPWSAAREEDVIDQFMHRQGSMHSVMTSRPSSTPSSTNGSAKNSPFSSPLKVGTLPRIDSTSSIGSAGGDRSERGTSILRSGGAGSREGGKRRRQQRHQHGDDDGSIGGSLSGSVSGSVTFGPVTYNSGKTHGTKHVHDPHSDGGSGVTMGSSSGSRNHTHACNHDDLDHGQGHGHSSNHSQHSAHSRSSSHAHKRAPLLINVVRNLHSP